MKKIALIVATLTLLAGCAAPEASSDSTQEQAEASQEKLTIVASFYPLAEFSRQVAGDLADVTSVTPTGADPHEYEPTPRQIAEALNADLFIYNGAGQDPWAEKLASELKAEGVEVIEMTSRFTLLEHGEEEEHDEHEEEEHAEDEHGHEEESHEEDAHDHERDPHVWLDPNLAIQEVEVIRDAVVKLDPANDGIYQSNTGLYTNELLALHDAFEAGLATCAKEDIITAHAAFGYMADRYNFNQISIAGLSTEEEPSARRLADLANLAEEKSIKYVFFEELVGPRLSETLANEVGAQTLVLNPIEGLTKDQMEAGENYGTLMEANLDNLRIALECE